MVPPPSVRPWPIAGPEGLFVYMGGHQKVPKDVTNVLIHESVKMIPRCAFEGCHKLRTVEFQEGVLVMIGDSAFQNCTNLEAVCLSSTVETVGIAAFLFCVSLRELTLNQGLAEIGCAAFAGCISLTNVSVPSTLGIIQEGTFLNCVRLEEVALPEGLTCIGSFSFANCDSLLPLPALPESIGSIGYQALPIASKDIEDYANEDTTKPLFVNDDHDDFHLKGHDDMLDSSMRLHHVVKVNAQRKLYIDVLRNKLEKIKLENIRLVQKLANSRKEKHELELALKLNFQRCRQTCLDDDDLSVASVAEDLISVPDEMDLSLSLDSDDLHDAHHPDDLLVVEVTDESLRVHHRNGNKIPPTSPTARTFKSCLNDMVQLLGATPLLRLPMKKFAEVDACMEEHHHYQQQQMRMTMERGLARDHLRTSSTDPEKVHHDDEDARAAEDAIGNVANDRDDELDGSFLEHCNIFAPTGVADDSIAEVVVVVVAGEIKSDAREESEDDWIADGFV